MDGPGEHYAQRNKPVREREVPYDLTCMWNLMNKITKQKQIHGYGEQTDSCQRGGGYRAE